MTGRQRTSLANPYGNGGHNGAPYCPGDGCDHVGIYLQVVRVGVGLLLAAPILLPIVGAIVRPL